MKRLLSVFPLILLLAVIVVAQTANSVTLKWTASTTPNVTYNIYHSASASGPFTIVNAAPITGLTYTDTVNLAGFWEARAVDASGSLSVATSIVTIPNAPTGFQAVGN